MFDGDLVSAMIVGEIAMRNAGAVAAAYDGRPDQAGGCNVNSISLASGIPKETVRRKVLELERTGRLVRIGDGYRCTDIITSELVQRDMDRVEQVATALLAMASAHKQQRSRE